MSDATAIPQRLEFFYDFSSPYAYLAHEEAQRFAARLNVPLQPRPFLLGGLFRTLQSAMVPILEATPQKREVLDRDIHRWAEVRELPLQWPSRFPMNSILALRVALQLEGDAHLQAMSAIFRAYWADDRDISDAADLAAVLDAAGLDGAALIAGSGAQPVKDALRRNTDDAYHRGAIGAPAFFWGDLHVFGQDRWEILERIVRGWRPSRG